MRFRFLGQRVPIVLLVLISPVTVGSALLGRATEYTLSTRKDLVTLALQRRNSNSTLFNITVRYDADLHAAIATHLRANDISAPPSMIAIIEVMYSRSGMEDACRAVTARLCRVCWPRGLGLFAPHAKLLWRYCTHQNMFA